MHLDLDANRVWMYFDQVYSRLNSNLPILFVQFVRWNVCEITALLQGWLRANLSMLSILLFT